MDETKEISTKKKHAGGRPSKYRDGKVIAEISLMSITILYEKGLIDTEICSLLNISEQTLNTLKKRHKKFLESIKSGKWKSDENVEIALYQRAIGYSHPEDKVFVNAQGEITIVPTIKYYPPDTAAAFIWLKNRKSDIWKDKHEIIQTTINQNGQIDVSQLTNDDIAYISNAIKRIQQPAEVEEAVIIQDTKQISEENTTI